jgi:Zn-dependent membrane protease YugP
VVFIAGVIIAIAKVLLNFATLPAELDASFKKALPILSEGYLPKQYYQPAKILLTAAAFTYVAKALADVINIFKWFILFRR